MFEIKKRDTYTDTERLLFNILMEIKALKMALTQEVKTVVAIPKITELPTTQMVPAKTVSTSRPKPKSKPKKKG